MFLFTTFRLANPYFFRSPLLRHTSQLASTSPNRANTATATASAPFDPYKILSVSSAATPADMKRQYRLLSKKYHVDIASNAAILPGNCNSLEDVAVKFNEIKQSYEILSDRKRRLRWDRGMMSPAELAGRVAGLSMFAVARGLQTLAGSLLDGISEQQLQQPASAASSSPLVASDVTYIIQNASSPSFLIPRSPPPTSSQILMVQNPATQPLPPPHFVELYSDDYIAVLSKPSGIRSVPSPSNPPTPPRKFHEHLDLATTARLKYRPFFNASFTPFMLTHRLDMDTSGIIIYALNKDAQKHLYAQFRDKEVVKRYEALVNGTLAGIEQIGTIKLSITR